MSVVIMTPSSILSTQELHVLFNQDLMPPNPRVIIHCLRVKGIYLVTGSVQ